MLVLNTSDLQRLNFTEKSIGNSNIDGLQGNFLNLGGFIVYYTPRNEVRGVYWNPPVRL